MRSVVLLVILAVAASGASVWPQPQSMEFSEADVPLCANFSFRFDSNVPVVQRALKRYRDLIFSSAAPSSQNCFDSLAVTLTDVNPSPSLGMDSDESYVLDSLSGIKANSFVGVLRALETFSSVIDRTSLALPAVFSIADAPRFPHRGLLIDSARHFLSVGKILRIIDAMSFTKLNVLHWHLTDAESFPLFVSGAPKLVLGAYSGTAFYSPADVASVVSFAYDRGIRVIPETDVPGHSASWGVGYSFAVATCPANLSHNINDVPLNPTVPAVYNLLSSVLLQLNASFPDEFVHLGGDEVVTGCWSGDVSIAAWMAQRNMNTTDLLRYFHAKLTALVPAGKTPIYWQEVFQEGVDMPPQSIVQVWKDAATLLQVAQAKRFALASFGWYVVANPMPTWQNFYLNEPCGDGFSEESESFVLGGEACAWGEHISDFNIEESLWPVVLGASERLWSSKSVNNMTEAQPRLVEKICQLNARNVPAGPIAPGFCR